MAVVQGGGGGVVIPQPVTATDDNNTIATRIAAGTTFPTQAVELDYGLEVSNGIPTNRWHRANRQDVPMTVRLFQPDTDPVPTIVITHGGGDTTFGPDDWQSQGNDNYDQGQGIDRSRTVFWTWNGTVPDYAAGETDARYHMPIAQAFNKPDSDVRRYAVIGLETVRLPTEATATYDGYAQLDLFPKEPTGQYRPLESDVSLTANFADRTLAGDLTNWRERGDSGRRFPDLTYTLSATEFDGAGFTGTLAPGTDCMTCPRVVTSGVAGTFYGPAAAEAGGTITVELDNTAGLWAGEPNSVGIGTFTTAQRQGQ